jgi:hypothetical protein
MPTASNSSPSEVARRSADSVRKDLRKARKKALEEAASAAARAVAPVAVAPPRTPSPTDVAAANRSNTTNTSPSPSSSPTPPTTTTPAPLRDRIVQLSTSPELFLVDGLIDQGACKALVASLGKLAASTVSGSSSTGGVDKSYRDSDERVLFAEESSEARQAIRGMDAFASAAAALAGRCDEDEEGELRPEHRSGALIRYKKGQKFERHHDHGSRKHLNRTLTVILYLNSSSEGGLGGIGGGSAETEEENKNQSENQTEGGGLIGGGTLFPEIEALTPQAKKKLPEGVEKRSRGHELLVRPRAGRAVAFFNTTPSGDLDERSLHAGEEVLAGEKVIVTQFYRAANR